MSTPRYAQMAVENARYWTNTTAHTPSNLGQPSRVPAPSDRAVRRRRIARVIEADPQIIREVAA